jgi:hypothetical protein
MPLQTILITTTGRPAIQFDWITLQPQKKKKKDDTFMGEDCGETTTEMGRHHQKRILVAAECKAIEETHGIRISGGEYCRGPGLMRAVEEEEEEKKNKKTKKKKKKKPSQISKCPQHDNR